MGLLVKPYPFQQAGIDFCYRHWWVLNGDEQGLGKTLQALGLIARVGGRRNIVVCPSALQATWAAEIDKFLPSHKGIIVVMSYDKFRKTEIEMLDCLIFDEAHYLKNPEAKRTRAAFDWVIVKPPRYLLMLTGTPIKNHITEFFAPIYILSACPWEGNGEKWHDGYWTFCNFFSNRKQIYIGSQVVNKFEGYKNLSKLKKLLKDKYVRRLAKNCLDLPELVRKEIWINDRSVDKKLAIAWEAYSGGGAYPTLKADAALGKASFTAAYVSDLLREGPVVIYTDHRAPVYEIEGRLLKDDWRVGIILGGISLRARQKTIEDFMGGRLDALVMTVGAASVGLTLTRSNHIVFNDIPWVPADLQQAEKRIHRIGQTRTSFIHYCLTGEVDQNILTKVLEKTRVIRKAANVV